MPYVENKGVSIHYEVESEEGDPIILMHGFASSLRSWYGLAYIDGLKANYRCILVDARGHGRSDKPHDTAAYAFANYVDDFTEILNTLDIHRAHYWGYGLGGDIGAAVAKLGGDRFKSVIMGAAAPGARDIERYKRYASELQSGLDPFLPQWPRYMRTAFHVNDHEALRAVALAAASEPPVELDATIAPVLVYTGSDDESSARAKAASSKTPPSVEYYEVPDVDYVMGFQRSDLILPRALAFLGQAAKAEKS